MHAEQAGAAAVMIVPPFYDALSWRELLAHYTAVADAIDVPIMYYNLPAAAGVRLAAAQFRESQSYPAAVKTACRLVGDTTGPVRPPLLPLDDAATRELAALLEHASLAIAGPGS